MTRPKDEMGSQIVSSESDISHPIPVNLSRNNNFQAQARRFPTPNSSSNSSAAWIFSHFRIQVRSADECVAPGRRQPRETRWTSDGRLCSPETNLKVGLLPLFFMQRLLSHMFPSFYTSWKLHTSMVDSLPKPLADFLSFLDVFCLKIDQTGCETRYNRTKLALWLWRLSSVSTAEDWALVVKRTFNFLFMDPWWQDRK